GFGKTTLVTRWLREVKKPAAWLSLDENDNNPQRFFTYLTAALQTVYPQLGQKLLAALQSPRPPEDEAVMPALINELSANEVALVLVLDDYHVLESPVIHNALAFFVDYAPPGITIVITSREDPPLPLPRWRARGQMVEIRAQDLRFEGTEVPAFLEETMGLQLPETAVSELAARTEGWVAGLQLAALSIRGGEDTADFIAGFGGSDRQIADYLLQEVLLRQTTADQQFMLRTAILERFNAALCDHLLEQENSQTILERLDQANLFLIPLDNRRVWYRYHHLFAQLLRSRLLREVSDAELKQLHLRAARWYEKQDLLEEAINHTRLIADDEYTAQLIAAMPSEALYEQGNASLLKTWIAELPARTVQRTPRVAVMAAAAHLITGDAHGLREYLALIKDDESTRAEQDLFNSILVRNGRADYEEALRLAVKARDGFAAEEMNLIVVAELQIAINTVNLGQAGAAKKVLHELRQKLDEDDVSTLNALIQVVHMQSNIALAEADFYQAQQLCRAGLILAERHPDQRAWPFAALLYLHLARIHYQWHAYVPAAEYLALGLDWGQRTGVLDILLESYLVQADLAAWRGDRKAVTAALDKVRELLAGHRWLEDIISKMEILSARYLLRIDEVDAAVRWANASIYNLDDDPAFGQVEAYRILAAVRLAECRQLGDQSGIPAILALLDHLLALLADAEHRFDRIECLVLKALALDWQGDRRAALQPLGEALDLAYPGSLIRVFVDQGRPMMELLARASHLRPNYVERLLKAFAAAPEGFDRLSQQDRPGTEPVKVPPATPPERNYEISAAAERKHDLSAADGPAIQLTKREGEVLNLIAAGYSNKEIEEALFISKNTVRTHIKNLYSKLDVKSRTQAVRKARQ
ncbi:MAG: LuxR C-terminal-related transcriptional regulator, partial [Candidatus Promineifilaceae bacterium]|nr:LuxR C-terminal-related transcriptional regulator [Candidatus Promineifilaceae bacterium]